MHATGYTIPSLLLVMVAASKPQKHRVAEMVDRYINEVLPEKKDGKNQGHQADVSDHPIADNRVVDIEPYRHQRLCPRVR